MCVWGRSSVWLEHSTVTREVAGSTPVGPVCRIGRGCISAAGTGPVVMYQRRTDRTGSDEWAGTGACPYRGLDIWDGVTVGYILVFKSQISSGRPRGEIGRHASLRCLC